MGDFDIEALLRDIGMNRAELTTNAFATLDDLGGTIHDFVKRLRRDSRRIRRNGEHGERLTHDQVVAAGDEIGDLLREYLGDVALLQALDEATIADASVGNITVATLEPHLRIAVRAIRDGADMQPTNTSLTPKSSARAAMDGALDRIDRYVCAVAIRLGKPIVDEQGPADD
jgi:hypothetical protein